jgi:hypothetical protein
MLIRSRDGRREAVVCVPTFVRLHARVETGTESESRENLRPVQKTLVISK